MANGNFPLFVDPRVGSLEIVKYLQIPCEVTSLKYGDVAFAGWGIDDEVWSIGIERKTIRDLANSILSGRLSGHQLLGLLDWYHVTYILVEGRYRIARDGVLELPETRGWRPLQGHKKSGHMFGYEEIANYLNTLAIVANVRIWFTDDLAMTGRWIRHTYYWWQKKFSEHRAHLDFVHQGPPPKRARWTRPTLEQRMIKELTDIGWDRSEEIVKVFPTMEEIMKAKPEDFVKIPKIGKVMAEKIYQELHRR